MAFIPTPNVAELVVEYQVSDKFFTNGFWFEGDIPFDVSLLNTLIDAFYDAWAEGIQTVINTATYLRQIRATAQDSATAPSIIRPITSGNQGVLAGDPMAQNAAMVVTFGTDKRGRSFRGRAYHGGLVYGAMDSIRTWKAASVAQVTSAYNTTLNAVEDEASVLQVIVSKQQGNVTLPAGDPTEVTSRVARSRMGTVRKRVSA